MAADLKPCPLCGSPAEFMFDGDFNAENEFYFKCQGAGCGLTLPSEGFIKDRAAVPNAGEADRWNARTTPEMVVIEVSDAELVFLRPRREIDHSALHSFSKSISKWKDHEGIKIPIGILPHDFDVIAVKKTEAPLETPDPG